MRAAAQRRLAAMVDPALATLDYAMKKRSQKLHEALVAARDVLDRTGLAAPTEIDLRATIAPVHHHYLGIVEPVSTETVQPNQIAKKNATSSQDG